MTPGELRALLDRLTGGHLSLDAAERKRVFDEVQNTFAEHLPLVLFAAPRVYVAVSTRVTNLLPALQRPQLLWSPDTLAVRR